MTYLNDLQRLVLNAAIADKDVAVKSFSAWQQHVALDDVNASDQRLIPLIYTNIGSMLPEPIANRLRGIKRHTWIRNRYRIEICGKLASHLAGQNIPLMLLKGAALMAAVTDDFGSRQMGDCDVLVPKAHRHMAFEALSREGFVSVPYDWSTLDEKEIDAFHGFTFELKDRISDVIDLHWRPLIEVRLEDLTDAFFEKSVSLSVAGQDMKVPCAEHMFLQCAVHGTEFISTQRYDWLADAALIVRGNPGIDWDLIVSAARKYRLETLLHASTRIMKEELQFSIPKEVLNDLSPKRSDFIARAEIASRMGRFRGTKIGEMVRLLQSSRRRRSGGSKASIWSDISETWRIVTQSDEFDGTVPTESEVVRFPYGWHHGEPNGRWSERRFATIAIRAAKVGFGKKLRVAMWPHQSPESPRQTVRIYSGARKLAVLRFNSRSSLQYFSSISLPEKIRTRDILPLQFYIGNKSRPAQPENSFDRREVGVFVSDIRTVPPKRDLTAAPIVLSGSSADIAVLWHGFSSPEHDGTWPFGSYAEIQWEQAAPLPEHSVISIDVVDVRPGLLGPTSAVLVLNGISLGAIAAEDLDALPKTFSFRVPEEFRSARHFELQFKFPRFFLWAVKGPLKIGQIRHAVRPQG
jgi:hypothetical protein